MALANDPDADRLGAAIPTSTRVAPPDRRRAGLAAGRSHPAPHRGRRPHGRDDARRRRSSAAWRRRPAFTTPRPSPGSSGSARVIREHPDQRYVFGYEQALGDPVASCPAADKDGITAALVMAEVAALAQARKASPCRTGWTTWPAASGVTSPAERSLRMEPAVAAAKVAALRADPPAALAGRAVDEVVRVSGGQPAADGLRTGPRPGPTERDRTQGEGVRRGRRRGPRPPHRTRWPPAVGLSRRHSSQG